MYFSLYIFNLFVTMYFHILLLIFTRSCYWIKSGRDSTDVKDAVKMKKWLVQESRARSAATLQRRHVARPWLHNECRRDWHDIIPYTSSDMSQHPMLLDDAVLLLPHRGSAGRSPAQRPAEAGCRTAAAASRVHTIVNYWGLQEGWNIFYIFFMIIDRRR